MADIPGRAASEKSKTAPRVWVVTGYRAGERIQILALAEALGWPFELKELAYRKLEFRTSLFRGSDLRGIRRQDSTPLQPPWPDLVISAGMRNEPVCRWIKQQAGGKTRVVHIGRPWASPERFDLVVTTPQYRLPQHKKVLHNGLTLSRVTPQLLDEQARQWRSRYRALPSPCTGIILGGSSGPYTFGRKTAMRLAKQANRMAAGKQGSLLITTSARTPDCVVEVLRQNLDVPFDLFQWQPGVEENPYFGILALSDELIVSSDSISMIGEACATLKPVYMLDFSSRWFPMRSPPAVGIEEDFSWKSRFYSLLLRFGPKRLGRDIRLVHKPLLDEGRVVWLGDEFNPKPLRPLEDMQRAIRRIQQLL